MSKSTNTKKRKLNLQFIPDLKAFIELIPIVMADHKIQKTQLSKISNISRATLDRKIKAKSYSPNELERIALAIYTLAPEAITNQSHGR